MNNLDAQRVMAVVDDALEGLTMISYLTPQVLNTAEDLTDVVGQEFSEATATHREIARGYECDEAESQLLDKSTLHLWRLVQRNPNALVKLKTLAVERSPPMLKLIDLMESLKQTVYKRLTTTVEEENSTRDYFEEVCRREEKAMAGLKSFRQQLAAEGRERSRALEQITNAEARSQEELEQIKMQSIQSARNLEKEAAESEAVQLKEFQEEEKKLLGELEKMKAKLEETVADNNEVETSLRKKKMQEEEKVTEWIAEYDSEMIAKEKVLQEEKAVYDEVQRQLKEYEMQYKKMKAEKEELQRQQEEAKRKQRERERREAALDKAARCIQDSWRLFQLAQQKKMNSEKKKGGKGKKK